MSTGFPLVLEMDLVDEQERDEDPLWDRRCLSGVERGVDGKKLMNLPGETFLLDPLLSFTLTAVLCPVPFLLSTSGSKFTTS